MSKKKKTSGFTNNFYAINKWVVDCDDLSEQLGLNGFLFNVLKSLFGMSQSRHSGTSVIRDSEKIVHYSIRNLMLIKRRDNIKFTIGDLLVELIQRLPEKEQQKIKDKL